MEAAERMHADLARRAKERKLEAWGQFNVSSPEKMGTQSKDMVDTRWVLTWKEVDGVKTAKARLLARGYQDPDLRNGAVDNEGCVSRRSSHLRLVSLVALEPGTQERLSPGGWF